MDEFKKPYEYFEEKGVHGILLILFFMLISIEPFMGILSLSVGYNSFTDSKTFMSVFIVLSAAYVLFAVFSGIVLKMLKSFAIAVTKVFLVYRVIYLIPILIFSMRYQIETISIESDYALQYNSIITSFMVSISYAVVFSAGWYIYLNKSRKVHELFPQKKSVSTLNQ
jgi:hypothetical protein